MTIWTMVVMTVTWQTSQTQLWVTAFTPKSPSSSSSFPFGPTVTNTRWTPQLHQSSNPSSTDESTTTTTLVNTQDAQTEKEFLARCKELCRERNIPFVKIKNARDLASVRGAKIQPNRILRMGRIGDATDSDIDLLFQTWNIQTLVDLRSPTELKDDMSLMRPQVFGNFTNIVWQERKSVTTKRDCLRVLPPGVGPVQYKDEKKVPSSSKFWQRIGVGKNDGDDPAALAPTTATATLPDNGDMLIATYDNFDEDDNVVLPEAVDDDEECGIECMDEPPAVLTSSSTTKPKERFFVSLMNEFKYVKGTVSKVRKRDITAAILKSPGAMFSKRIRSSLKQPFLKEINDGGLPMLNELLFKFGAPGIRYVLQLCSDRSNHPIAFYCTAGKDRTGAIAAIILSLCGTDLEDIVEDYTLSANVYAEMGDHQAMVGALSQRNLDPKTFLGAPPTVMRTTMEFIKEEYGSVENYCIAIGFNTEQQQQLIKACMEP